MMKFPSRYLSLVWMASEAWKTAVSFRPSRCGRLRASSTLAAASAVPSGGGRPVPTLAARRRQCPATAWTTTPRGGALFSTTTTTTSTTALHSAVTTTSSSATDTAQPPAEIFRRDYEPLAYTVSDVELDFDIRRGRTVVTSRLHLVPNPEYPRDDDARDTLVLDGDETSVRLLSLQRDDGDGESRELRQGEDYELAPGKLILKNLPPSSPTLLTTRVAIVPEDNTQLSGLYKSGGSDDGDDGMYCTQCEAMGFRRITYYPDRPDVMAVFTRVRLEADRQSYPVLLANGNLIEEGDVSDDDTRHYAVWSDPYPKPSYLFCCVAGDLEKVESAYTTRPSGREVRLAIFSEPHNVHKLDYAMQSLIKSMKWDEDKFGLEYDLDIYNIVAVDDFNMGAMENKGLNVFNTAFVLADQETATDADFERVEGVIGHEYFHNWTGNRVTCRDWFQLTLKEGLTVFRDQEFSGDLNSKAVNRIENVRSLRAQQFAEDASPMSHPIRPESYISMDNFYTATVYIKGAEVIRMYQTLLGVQGFRKGMDLYFERHDGQAVTCDDFLAAMADANEKDLSQFARWYSTPGTPTLTYETKYDSAEGKFSLTLTQSSNSEQPMLIPVAVGLLDKTTGEEVVPTTVLELTETMQTFSFDVKSDVVPSILRQFSAPVKIVSASGDERLEDLAFLAARDTDGFNRWDAGQKLYTTAVFEAMKDSKTPSDQTYEYVKEAFGRTLGGKKSTDYSIIAYALMLPSEGTLAELVKGVVDPLAIKAARGSLKKALARDFQSELQTRYEELTQAMEGQEFKVDAESIGMRRLRNVCLDYLCTIKETPDEQKAAAELATKHFEAATGMTDKMAALSCLSNMDGEGASARDKALQKFYDDANGDALVLNKWFSVQALADLPDVLDRVKALTKHPDFTLKNPNRCRSLIGAFTMNTAFHDTSGAGYQFLGVVLVELDKLNPQISSRLARSLITWRKYSEERGALMKAELEKLVDMKPISEDMYEIVSRGLK